MEDGEVWRGCAVVGEVSCKELGRGLCVRDEMGAASVCGEDGWLWVFEGELGIAVGFRGFLGVLGCGIGCSVCCVCVKECGVSVRFRSVSAGVGEVFSVGSLIAMRLSGMSGIEGGCGLSAECV